MTKRESEEFAELVKQSKEIVRALSQPQPEMNYELEILRLTHEVNRLRKEVDILNTRKLTADELIIKGRHW